MFLDSVIPAFFDGDERGILERAKMTTEEGALAKRFKYLQDYVNNSE